MSTKAQRGFRVLRARVAAEAAGVCLRAGRRRDDGCGCTIAPFLTAISAPPSTRLSLKRLQECSLAGQFGGAVGQALKPLPRALHSIAKLTCQPAGVFEPCQRKQRRGGVFQLAGRGLELPCDKRRWIGLVVVCDDSGGGAVKVERRLRSRPPTLSRWRWRPTATNWKLADWKFARLEVCRLLEVLHTVRQLRAGTNTAAGRWSNMTQGSVANARRRQASQLKQTVRFSQLVVCV